MKKMLTLPDCLQQRELSLSWCNGEGRLDETSRKQLLGQKKLHLHELEYSSPITTTTTSPTTTTTKHSSQKCTFLSSVPNTKT